MKAIKDARFIVTIVSEGCDTCGRQFHWYVNVQDDIGLHKSVTFSGSFVANHKEEAIENWERFAELNNIKNWEVQR
jgi:hypothetical protein